MIKEAIEKILDLKKPETVIVDDRPYSTVPLTPVTRPSVAPLKISTLTGLIDYLNTNDAFVKDDILVTVDSYKTVTVRTMISHPWRQRETLIECNADLPQMHLNSFIDLENMNIMLQSMFVEGRIRTELLKLVGNVREDNVQNYCDDGVSQQVTAKAGVAKIEDVKVPNPVELAPFRTFPEIEQPSSLFVFRMRQGPVAALIEADGGAWKNKAVLSIKAYLEGELPNIQIIA